MLNTQAEPDPIIITESKQVLVHEILQQPRAKQQQDFEPPPEQPRQRTGIFPAAAPVICSGALGPQLLAMTAFFENRQSQFNWDALKSTSPITPDVRSHLTRVYSTLAGAVLTAAVGTACHMLYDIGGALTTIGVFVMLIWLSVTPATPQNELMRLGIMNGLAFFQGCSIGPLVDRVADFNPEIILTAFIGTMCIFACFSAAAMFSEQRTRMYLAGWLSSGLTLLFWLGLANIFFRSSFVLNVQLYGGLFLFVGFVVYDTQLIIEKANSGQRDFVRHALELFLDFVSIFIRLLVILSKNRSENTNEKKKSRR